MSITSRGGGQAVLITGVSSGIGLGMARKFLAEGYRVFGSVRSEDKAQELQARLGAAFTPLVFDLCNPAQIADAERRLRELLPEGHLAALINNAGIAEIGPLLHVPPDDLLRQLDVLVVGQLRVIQTFYRYLLPKHGKAGRIFNISSVSGVNPNYFFGCYAAGKHALEGLSKTLRNEIRNLGIPVVVIAPGNIVTDIWPKQTVDLIEKYRSTDYFSALERTVSGIGASSARTGMTVDEFSDALFGIFRKAEVAPRYTIEKGKRRRVPLSRFRVRVRER